MGHICDIMSLEDSSSLSGWISSVFSQHCYHLLDKKYDIGIAAYSIISGPFLAIVCQFLTIFCCICLLMGVFNPLKVNKSILCCMLWLLRKILVDKGSNI